MFSVEFWFEVVLFVSTILGCGAIFFLGIVAALDESAPAPLRVIAPFSTTAISVSLFMLMLSAIFG